MRRVLLPAPTGATFLWDGRDNTGVPVRRGVYYLRWQLGSAYKEVKLVRTQ